MADLGTRQGVLARNSFANLIRVASTSLVSLLLPLVLVAILEPRLYAVWALLFGLAGFVLYLDFGLPTSVQTLVARAETSGDTAERSQVARSGLRWAVGIGSALLLIIVVIGMNARALFPALGSAQGTAVAATLLLIALGNVSTLVGNTVSGFFAAQQRSSVAAITLVPGRIGSLCLAVLAALTLQDVLVVAAVYAAPLLLGALAITVRMLRETRVPAGHGRVGMARYLVLRYSGPLTAWSLYMLCISGAGVVIVGRVDYRSIAIFSLATAFSAALTGVQTAIIAPILSELGRSYALEDHARSTRIVLTASAFNGAVVAIGIVGIQSLYLVFQPLLDRATQIPSGTAAAIVGLTVLAGGIRLTMSPLTFAFIGSGSHRRLLLPPMCEAIVTLAATIGLGAFLGAFGVAVGLVTGATSGVVLTLLWSHRITKVVALSGRTIALQSALKPLAAIAVAEAAFFAIGAGTSAEAVRVLGAVVMVLLSGSVLWFWCVPKTFHSMFGALLAKLPGRPFDRPVAHQ